MAVTVARVVGKDLAIAAKGNITQWEDFDIAFMEETDKAAASDDTESSIVRTTHHIEGKVTGFLGSMNNGGTLPKPGDVISDLAVKLGTDSLLPSLTGYTNIKYVAPIRYTFKQGVAKFEANFRSAVLN